MGAALPTSTWRRLLRGENGFDAAAHSMHHFFDDHVNVVTPLDALHTLWHLHCSAQRTNGSDVAALLLLVATTGRLEMQLASMLLLMNPLDVAEDLMAFAVVADRWCAGRATSSALHSTWIKLLHVGIVYLKASATSTADKERVRNLQSTLQIRGTATLPAEVDEDLQDEESMPWNEFLALDFGLDQSGLLRTKDGRRSAQQLTMVSAQQQAQCCLLDEFSLRGSPATDASEKVWEAVATLLKCCGLPFDSNATTTVAQSDTYECFCDEATLVRHVCASSREAAPSAASPAQEQENDEVYSSGESSVEQLPSATKTIVGLVVDEAFINDQIHQLETIEDPSVLRIRVASLLGLQLQRGTSFAASLGSTRASQWEQSVRKAVNTLTSADKEGSDGRQLLALAAVHPNAVIEIVLGSALTSSHHHELFNRLLLDCPLLAKWPESTQARQLLEWEGSILVSELSRALRQLVLDTDASSPMENSASFRFLLRLVTPLRHPSPLECETLSDAVVPLDASMRYILWSVLESVGHSANSRVFTLIGCFLDHIRQFRCGRLPTKTIQKSVETAVSTYAALAENAAAEHQELQDSALITTDSLLRASSSSTIRSLQSFLHASVDDRMQCLLASHGVAPLPMADDNCSDSESTGGDTRQLSEELLRSITQSLWCLVWAQGRACLDTCLVHLNQLQARAFVDGNGLTVAGACVVQSQVAGMLLSSGGRVFDRIVQTIVERILPMDPAKPNFSLLPTGQQAQHSADSISCPQHIMEYVLRCWSVAAFASRQSNERLVTRMLNRVIGLVDRAIESARSDPNRLLRCLQAGGLLYSWLRTHQPQDGGRGINCIEVSATRVLFLLRECQSNGSPGSSQPSEGADIETRSMVATVLVSTRLLESETIVSFLRSKSYDS